MYHEDFIALEYSMPTIHAASIKRTKELLEKLKFMLIKLRGSKAGISKFDILKTKSAWSITRFQYCWFNDILTALIDTINKNISRSWWGNERGNCSRPPPIHRAQTVAVSHSLGECRCSRASLSLPPPAGEQIEPPDSPLTSQEPSSRTATN